MELLSKLIASRPLSALLLFLVSFALYAPSLKNDFVWDDVEVITKSNISFDASYITSVVVTDVYKNKNASYYRPAVYTSYVADKAVWGVSSFGFHLSNLLFNSLSVVLFYFMALLVLGGFGVSGKEACALLSSILFALHPMHVESASWIAGRSDVLCALFLFLALIFHTLSSRNIWLLGIAALGFSLSLMSKEVAVVFPFLALVFDLLARRFLDRRNIIRYGVYLLILLVYFYLRSRAFVNIPQVTHEISGEGAARALSGGEHISTISRYLELLKILLGSYLFYLNKLVLPFDFNAFITKVPREAAHLISAPMIIASLAVLVFISAKKKENVTAFGILWVLFTLGPSALIALFTIASTPLAERYLYIPSAGFCLVVGHFVIQTGKRARLRKVAWGFGIILVAIYAFATYQREAVWKDDLSLWRDASFKSPYHPLPHSNYGLALSNIGDQDEAIREFVIALSPEMNDSPRGKAVTANNLALVYLDKEEYEKAEIWLRKALEYDPGYGKTYYHLGLIYYINGELTNSADSYAQAERYVKETMKRYKYYGRANLLLAKIYLRTGDTDKAKKEAQNAIGIGLPKGLLKEARDILEIDNSGGYHEPK
jgi:tetratricopeptide (TPR) repeat protein